MTSGLEGEPDGAGGRPRALHAAEKRPQPGCLADQRAATEVADRRPADQCPQARRAEGSDEARSGERDRVDGRSPPGGLLAWWKIGGWALETAAVWDGGGQHGPRRFAEPSRPGSPPPRFSAGPRLGGAAGRRRFSRAGRGGLPRPARRGEIRRRIARRIRDHFDGRLRTGSGPPRRAPWPRHVAGPGPGPRGHACAGRRTHHAGFTVQCVPEPRPVPRWRRPPLGLPLRRRPLGRTTSSRDWPCGLSPRGPTRRSTVSFFFCRGRADRLVAVRREEVAGAGRVGRPAHPVRGVGPRPPWCAGSGRLRV